MSGSAFQSGIHPLRPVLLQAVLLGAGMLAQSPCALGESETQLWGNLILGFDMGERWGMETDIEPKVLVSGGDAWRNLDVKQIFEYYPNRSFDLVGEIVGGYTHQFEDVDTTELTERIGVRVNLLHNLREMMDRSTQGLGRISLAVLTRLEHRTFWYSNGGGTDDDWRLRMRFETKGGINNADMSQDGTLYGLFDVEYYWALSDELEERFTSKARARAGLGYRINSGCRVELLYQRDWERDLPGDEPRPDANIIDMRVKLFF